MPPLTMYLPGVPEPGWLQVSAMPLPLDDATRLPGAVGTGADPVPGPVPEPAVDNKKLVLALC